MRKKQLAIALSVLALGAALITLGRGHETRSKAVPPPPEIPDSVLYKHLFRHVIALQKQAGDAEKDGKDSTQFKTHYKRKASLTEAQAVLLEQVASQWDQEVQLIAVRAKPLIDAYKAQYPNGQVPHGQPPGPPPEELRKLSEERDACTLRARDRLHAELGDQEFARFHDFVKTRIAPNIQMQNR